MNAEESHPILKLEAKESRDWHHKRNFQGESALEENEDGHRGLVEEGGGENTHQDEIIQMIKDEEKKKEEKKKKKERKKHLKELEDLRNDSGIQTSTMHGMMIDAGSSGSRMHVYEFKPRILHGYEEISEAIAGRTFSYPGTDSRWTNRLRPGISAFADLSDEDLTPAIAEYLRPLIEFAETILRSKTEYFAEFPIYLKATAGMRILEPHSRSRIITACRNVLNNSTYSKFKFEKAFARVISGEEEAIYGWVGANFVLGSVLKNSKGIGTVENPQLTHGTLEMGGASAQIAFYQQDEDVMNNLFKLQIGQGKHWNVYAHSSLYFGINEAWNRMGAFIVGDEALSENISNSTSSFYNPCLPGKSKVPFESSIYFVDGHDSRKQDSNGTSSSYNVLMKNDKSKGNYEQCSAIARELINKRFNKWCDFSHHGDCSISGAYQPRLPKQTHNFGEFIGFSHYFESFDFLGLPSRSSLGSLQNATMNLCSMSKAQLKDFNHGRMDKETAQQMCFRSTYIFEMLSSGYGFHMEDVITATDVVDGHKMGWALGSMLYEINTLPWTYPSKHKKIHVGTDHATFIFGFVFVLAVFLSLSLIRVFRRRHFRWHGKREYTSLSDVQMENVHSDE